MLQPILILGGALALTLALAAGLQLLQRFGVETIERRLFVRTVADLAARLSRVRVSALDGLSGPELANRFFDVLTLQKAAGTLLLDGFTALLQVTVAVVVLGLYHPWLLVFDVVLLAGMVLVLFPLGRGAQRTAILESKAKYAVAAWIEEVARHPIVLRQDGSELALNRADMLARTWLRTRSDHFRVFLRQFTGVQFLQVLMSALLLIASGALVLQGEITVGQLVAGEFIVATALLGFAKFADKLDTVYDLLAGVDKLGSLLDLPPERLDGLAPHVEPGRGSHVEVEDAKLAPELPVVSLSLPPGSRTTVLGGPGTGKSRLSSLVAGYRTPTTGVVRRDGLDIRQMRPSARYDGVVRICPRDLIGGSLRDNISLGRPGITDQLVWESLRAVGLQSVVEQLPRGLDTEIDGVGRPLSTAQGRALLVARAIVGTPRLLIVDGVLDGLPPELRGSLQELLIQDDAPWTLLLLTSNPASVHPKTTLRTLSDQGLS